MSKISNVKLAIVFAIIAIAATSAERHRSNADDWPQWRGPQRNAVSKETGLLQSWPVGGPKVSLKATGLGTGYASVVVRGERLYTIGRHEANVLVIALDTVTGKPLWTQKIGETDRNPSSTPTLDGDYLYALDPDGDLACLRAATGEIVWTKNLFDDFAGRMMSARGNGESPLIDGDRLICTPGGPDAAMVALNKLTGAVIWKSKVPELGPLGKDGAGFSSAVVSEAAGIRQYVQLMGRGLVGVAASDGRFLWGYNAIANDSANIPTPLVHDDLVFSANGYTAGSVLLKLVPARSEDSTMPALNAEVVYSLSGSQFQNHHGGVIRIGDLLFAGHGNNNGLPTCVDFQSGRVLWKRRGPGVGSAAVIYADGQLIYRYQDGVVALIDASKRGYNLRGTFEIPGAGGDSWAHPVVANGHLYLREQDVLWVHDLRIESESNPTAPTSTSTTESPATIKALRKRGVVVDIVNVAETGSPSKSNSKTSIYKYAAKSDDDRPSKPIVVATLNDSHLFTDGAITDEVLTLLKELPEPLILSLAGTGITDEGLSPQRMPNVAGINLESCSRLTDSGLKHLLGNKHLRLLILSGTSITHAGLQHLVNNPNLTALDLELCDGIKDNACETIRLMKPLRFLVLKKSGFERPGITVQGLEPLCDLSNLEVLNLYGNTLTDPDLVHLKSLTNLRELNLSLLNITDAGLEHLKPLTKLELLELLFSEGFAGPTLTNGVADFLQPMTELVSLNLTGARN